MGQHTASPGSLERNTDKVEAVNSGNPVMPSQRLVDEGVVGRKEFRDGTILL